MLLLKNILKDLTHIFYPRLCAGCGTDIIDEKAQICLHCLRRLPITNFHDYADNPVEKIFHGRIPLTSASSLCYFSKDSVIRVLMHQLKYRGHKELGYFLGKMTGQSLIESNRFRSVDALVPLPLFASREKKRGYNQSQLLCEGIAAAMALPIWENIVKRISFTGTQTKKSRMQRWENMEGRFLLTAASQIKQRHILLVDDVVTTGATLEACGQELLKAEGVQLSIATLAYAVK